MDSSDPYSTYTPSNVAPSASITSPSNRLAYSKDLWDKFNDIINKLVSGKSNVKQIQALFITQRDVMDKFGQNLYKTKINTDENLYELIPPTTRYVQFAQASGLKLIESAVIIRKEYLEEIGALRKEISTNIKRAKKEEAKLVSEYRAAKDKVEKAKKKDFEDKNKFEQLQTTLYKADGLPPKKLTSLQKDVHKAEEQATRSELDYENSHKSLESMHTTYHQKLSTLMEQLEELDRKRIQSMRALMIRYATQQKEISQIIEREAQYMIEANEAVDEEKEIQTFIRDHHSKTFPQPIEPCEPYKVAFSEDAKSARLSKVFKPTTNSASSTPSTTPSTAGQIRSMMNGQLDNSEGKVTSPPNNVNVIPPSPIPTVDMSTPVTMNLNVIKRVKVLYDYTPTGDEELAMMENDIVDVLEVVEDGWWVGSLRGNQGFFPCNFVTDNLDFQKSPNVMDSPAVINSDQTVALYDYAAQDDSELSIKEGERLIIVKKNEDGWWFARSESSGKEGLIPSNFVQQ
ncbi:hypothetical protein AKO1_012135 [Acrasis kona]|uniref:SH3 domain-containing protein n=1 Tax=Acrasis kona TaxID=1008807 RepID=A0AAW2ZAL9_9EUKA